MVPMVYQHQQNLKFVPREVNCAICEKRDVVFVQNKGEMNHTLIAYSDKSKFNQLHVGYGKGYHVDTW